VIVFNDQSAVIPGGKPIPQPIPVASVVVWVRLGSSVLTQTVGVDDAELQVLELEVIVTGLTVIVPVAFVLPQPPVNGIL
jgi:hypothetical protein